MVERATSLHGGAIWRTYGSRAEMSRTLTALVADSLSLGLETRGAACAALAGGVTPLPVYDRLAHVELDWARVRVCPTDERCAAPDHPARNDRALRLALQRGLARDAHVVSLEDEAAVAALPAFDVALLGMGADGHIASLFPRSEGLAAAMDPEAAAPAARVVPDPLPADAPFVRITLTLARLINAHKIVLMIAGEEKRRVALAAVESGDRLDPPLRGLFAAAHVEVHWSA